MTNHDLILDLAMNLSRIGNWVGDGFESRKEKITTFINQTTELLDGLDTKNLPPDVIEPLAKLIAIYPRIILELQTKPEDEQELSETLLTYGNILTHRAKLVQK